MFCLVFGFLLFAFLFSHGDSSMDYVSNLFSSLLYCMQIELRKECFYIYFSPLGFAQALHCDQKASHAVLGT